MISVIMPVFNAEKYIKKSIESILNQTENDLELILIDDCGDDSSMEIANSIKDDRIKILKNARNMGIAYSRNKGLDAAQGNYIALMDDDDIAPLNRLEIEKKYLESNTNIDVVAGKLIIIDENDNKNSYPNQVIYNPKRIWAELMFHDVIMNGSAMMRTNFVRKYNLRYKNGFWGMEDYKFWTECSVYGQIANVEETLLLWRRTENTASRYIINNYENERNQAYSQIQKEAFSMNGFVMSDEEFQIFSKNFGRKKNTYITISDLEKVHNVLVKLVEQAKCKKMSNFLEFEFVCHRMFALKTENSEIWR